MTTSQAIIHWNTLATTSAGAVSAVFSEPDMDQHTLHDVALIVDSLRCPEDARLVEIGCGVGRLTSLVADVTGASILGLDISEKMIGWAEQWKHPDVNVAFAVGDVSALRALVAEGHSAHGIYSMLVFQHVPDLEVQAYLRAMTDLLVPGGVMVFQYVVGDIAADFDHRRSQNRMVSWLSSCGLDYVTMPDSRHSEWHWVKARKPE
jgi:cyclopropane fatty-acyl-phospholipid synthase-like methyltransferase